MFTHFFSSSTKDTNLFKASFLSGMLNSERDVRAFPKILATSGSKKETNTTSFSLDLLALCKIFSTTLGSYLVIDLDNSRLKIERL